MLLDENHDDYVNKDENVDVNFSGIHPKLNTNNLKYKAERKSLQVLQQTPDNRLTRNADLQSAKHVKGTTKPFPIFKDPAKCSTPKAAARKGSTPKSVANKECKHNSSQTESFNCCHCSCHEDEDEVIEEEEEEEDNKEDLSAEEEAYRLMGQEEVPEDYWKEVADTRSAALEVSMHENELLNSEVAALRKENRRLSELAENAEYFAKILKDLTEDNKSESEQDSDKGHDDDCHSNSDSENNTNERINEEQTNKATINKSDDDETSYTAPKGRAYPICCSSERQDLDLNANTEDHSSP